MLPCCLGLLSRATMDHVSAVKVILSPNHVPRHCVIPIHRCVLLSSSSLFLRRHSPLLGRSMTPSHSPGGSLIDKRDFDSNRPLLDDVEQNRGTALSPAESRSTTDNDRGDDSDGLLNDVVEGIVERDRRKLQKEVVRVCSFSWGVISW